MKWFIYSINNHFQRYNWHFCHMIKTKYFNALMFLSYISSVMWFQPYPFSIYISTCFFLKSYRQLYSLKTHNSLVSQPDMYISCISVLDKTTNLLPLLSSLVLHRDNSTIIFTRSPPDADITSSTVQTVGLCNDPWSRWLEYNSSEFEDIYVTRLLPAKGS